MKNVVQANQTESVIQLHDGKDQADTTTNGLISSDSSGETDTTKRSQTVGITKSIKIVVLFVVIATLLLAGLSFAEVSIESISMFRTCGKAGCTQGSLVSEPAGVVGEYVSLDGDISNITQVVKQPEQTTTVPVTPTNQSQLMPPPQVPNLHLVTFSNNAQKTPKWCPLVRSASCAGSKVWVLGRSNLTELGYIMGCRQKLVAVYQLLVNRAKNGFSDHSIFCFLDAHDTLVLRPLHDFEQSLLTYLREHNLTVLFNSEILQDGINSGVYCGQTIDVFNFLDKLMNDTFVSMPNNPDQQLVRHMLHTRPRDFQITYDKNHTLLANNAARGYEPSFCPLHLLTPEELANRVASKGMDSVPKSLVTGQFPYIMHFAGSMNKKLHSECGQSSCAGLLSTYYDVDYDVERSCPPLQ